MYEQTENLNILFVYVQGLALIAWDNFKLTPECRDRSLQQITWMRLPGLLSPKNGPVSQKYLDPTKQLGDI